MTDTTVFEKFGRFGKGWQKPENKAPGVAKSHNPGKVNMDEEVKGEVRKQRGYEQETMHYDRPEIKKTSKKKRSYRK